VHEPLVQILPPAQVEGGGLPLWSTGLPSGAHRRAGRHVAWRAPQSAPALAL